MRLDVTDNPSLTSGNYFEVYDQDGKIFDSEIEIKMRKKFDDMTKEGRQFMDALGKDLPLETVLSLDENDRLKLSKKEMRFFNWLKTGIEGWDNTNLANLSARGHYWENENQFSGGDGFVIDGFYNVINIMAEPFLKQKRILFEHAVEKIDYSDQCVQVQTNRGTFVGDFAICTVPLGVLKSQKIAFEPNLPSWKLESIDNIGFGLMNKIVLEFPYVFWKENVEGMGYVSDHRGEFNFFLNLLPLTKRPILMGFVAADFAHLIESWTDEQIVTSVMKTLRKIFEHQKERKVPDVTRFKITRWAQDKFAMGSYSFLAYGSTLRDIEQIALPVGRVHFAGEATFKPLGFTHGAFLSGIREADRIASRMRTVIAVPQPQQQAAKF